MDDKKLKKIKAKERSFVMKLTKKDIETILYNFGGYELNNNVYSEADGKKLPPIERGYNQEKQEYQIMIRCKNDDKTAEDLYNSLTASMPYLVSGGYNPRNSIIILTDYSVAEINLGYDIGKDKQIIYAKYMYEKFGEYYRIKYNQAVRKEIKKSKDEERTK